MSKKDRYLNLPNLEDVISRESLPPVCLYNFYIIMRDRLEYEELLDFYLDIKQYEQLWKRYSKDNKKNTNIVLEKDLADKVCDDDNVDEKFPKVSLYPLKNVQSQGGNVSSKMIKGLIGYSERIQLRYLELGAPKEVRQLPLKLKLDLCRALHSFDGNPMVFKEAKEFCFHYMQQYAYPKFIKVKAYENVTLAQKMFRLLTSLLCLLFALTTSLCLIFLGYPQWGVRFLILIPFWLGMFNFMVFLTGVDPIWVLIFNKSETTTFHFNSIIQPQVKKILRKRSVWSLFIGFFISLICTIIFCAIPPHTL